MRHLTLACLVLCSLGCDRLLGIESTRFDPGETEADDCDLPSEPENGIGWWSGCDQNLRCASAGLPTPSARPAASTEGADIDPIVLGFDRIQLGARNAEGELDPRAWSRMGFDLDGLCTSSPTCGATSVEAGRVCAPRLSDPAVDGEYCRDNQLGLLDYKLDTLEQTRGKYMATASQLNCALCQGGYNLLGRITGYNGQPNDPAVHLELFPSPGLEVLKNVDCSEEFWDEDACWTDAEPFLIDRAYVDQSGEGELGSARFYDPSAFVHDGWLVAELPQNTPLGLVSHHQEIPKVVRMAIQNGLLVMRLHREDGAWRGDDGVLAGATRLGDLLDEFARLGLCEATDPVGTAVIQTFMESAADMLSTGAVAPETPCDALSLGMAVRAKQASLGELVEVPEQSSAECHD